MKEQKRDGRVPSFVPSTELKLISLKQFKQHGVETLILHSITTMLAGDFDKLNSIM